MYNLILLDLPNLPTSLNPQSNVEIKRQGETSCLLSWMDIITGAGTNCSTSFVVEYSDYIVLIWARSSPVTDM